MLVWKLLSISLLIFWGNSFANDYQSYMDELYRFNRRTEERTYVKNLEAGIDARKPFTNQQYDEIHDYESILGY